MISPLIFKGLALFGMGLAHGAVPAGQPPAPSLPNDEPIQIVAPPSRPDANAPTQFMSTVQLAITEAEPELMQRSQRVVLEQLNRTISGWPQFRGHHAQIRTSGNEVVLYLVTNEDLRRPMQQAVSDMITNLNGRVKARGRSLYYRTSTTRPLGGYLEVVVNDKHTRVNSIAAQSVPLRDVLKEMKSRLGGLSYLIPGECADRLVDWNFGLDAKPGSARKVDSVMSDLATLFGLKSEKRDGTYIFTGACADQAKVARPVPASEMIQPFFPMRPPRQPSEQAVQVYFPLSPIGN